MALLPLSSIYRVFASTWTQGQWPQWLCTAVHFLNVVKPVDYVMDINHCDPGPKYTHEHSHWGLWSWITYGHLLGLVALGTYSDRRQPWAAAHKGATGPSLAMQTVASKVRYVRTQWCWNTLANNTADIYMHLLNNTKTTTCASDINLQKMGKNMTWIYYALMIAAQQNIAQASEPDLWDILYHWMSLWTTFIGYRIWIYTDNRIGDE